MYTTPWYRKYEGAGKWCREPNPYCPTIYPFGWQCDDTVRDILRRCFLVCDDHKIKAFRVHITHDDGGEWKVCNRLFSHGLLTEIYAVDRLGIELPDGRYNARVEIR